MKRYKKIVVEKIEDGKITLEVTLKSSRIWHMVIDENKIVGSFNVNDLLELKNGKFYVLRDETEREKDRIQEKLNRLFNKN